MIKIFRKSAIGFAAVLLLITIGLCAETAKPGTNILAAIGSGVCAYLTIFLTVKSFIWEIEGIADEAVERMRKDAAK